MGLGALKLAARGVDLLGMPRHATEEWASVLNVRGPLTPVVMGATGEVSVTPHLLASVVVPDPGWPYRVMAQAHSEAGSMATGTRWNHGLSWRAQGSDVSTKLVLFQKEETVDWSVVNTGGPVGRFEGPATVRYFLSRAYGTGSAMFTEYNCDLRVWLYPASPEAM